MASARLELTVLGVNIAGDSGDGDAIFLSLPQSLDEANLLKASKLRDSIATDLVSTQPAGGTWAAPHLQTLHRHSLVLYDPISQASQWRGVSRLLDNGMLEELRGRGLVNWSQSGTLLYALRTPGDGNCLLHALSLVLWGVDDRDLTLRTALHDVLRQRQVPADLFCRWQRERNLADVGTGLKYTSQDWEAEWRRVVLAARPCEVPGNEGLRYECLEELHIFVMANVLRRPIVVLADQVMRTLWSASSLAPLHVHGVYLPLYWPAQQAFHHAIFLGYSDGHFVPLVPSRDPDAMEDSVVRWSAPLSNSRGNPLPVRMLMASEEGQASEIQQRYVSTVTTTDSDRRVITLARLGRPSQPDGLDLARDFYELVKHAIRRRPPTTANGLVSGHTPSPTIKGNLRENPSSSQETVVPFMSALVDLCMTPGCPYNRSTRTGSYCHECFGRHHAKGEPLALSPSSEESSLALKCRTPACPFTAETDGFCSLCMRRQASAKPRLSLQPNFIVAASQQSAIPTASVPQRPRVCIMPDCKALGEASLRGLCHNCFQTQNIDTSKEPHDVASANLLRCCRQAGCPYFGTEDKEGYCTLCFMNFLVNIADQSLQARGGSDRQASTQPHVLPRTVPPAACPESGRSCRNTYCGREGIAHLHGLCAQCESTPLNTTTVETSSVLQPSAHQSPTTVRRSASVQVQAKSGAQAKGNTTRERCQAPGCEHFGNANCSGYCNECFVMMHRYGR
uniref:tumor necrosis factor alpha-induced protein 3 isoform X2 n=1 Tax=Myxine glutinosa TaxID=7769 RepID=UPI00358FB9B9